MLSEIIMLRSHVVYQVKGNLSPKCEYTLKIVKVQNVIGLYKIISDKKENLLFFQD